MRNFTRFLLAVMALVVTGGAYALPPDVTVNPAPGQTVESISEIQISAGWLDKKDDNVALLINGRSYTSSVTVMNFDMLKLSLENPITAEGTYTVVIPEGAFFWGWEYDDSPLIEFQLIVENGSGGGDDPGKDEIQNVVPEGYTFSPAAGTEVDVLTKISVSASNEFFLTSKLHPGITVNGVVKETVYTVSGDGDNTLTWTFAEPIAEPGYYTVMIPEGAFFGLSEIDNQHFIVTVVVKGGEIPEAEYFSGEVTSSPDNEVPIEFLSRIAVMFPKLTAAYLGPQSDNIVVSCGGEKVDAEFTLTPDPDDFNDPHIMWLEFADPIIKKGEYVITFPAQSFIIGKYPVYLYTAPFELRFTVTGPGAALSQIEDDSEAAPADYFTITGQRVDTPTSKGVYIVRRGSKVAKEFIR